MANRLQLNLPNTTSTSPPCETRFQESGSLNDLEFSFFWSGTPKGERRDAGVGFAITKGIVTKLTEMPRPVSDRS